LTLGLFIGIFGIIVSFFLIFRLKEPRLRLISGLFSFSFLIFISQQIGIFNSYAYLIWFIVISLTTIIFWIDTIIFKDFKFIDKILLTLFLIIFLSINLFHLFNRPFYLEINFLLTLAAIIPIYLTAKIVIKRKHIRESKIIALYMIYLISDIIYFAFIYND